MSLRFSWTDGDTAFDYYYISLNPNATTYSFAPCENTSTESCILNRMKNLTSITFQNLTSGQNYTATIYTSIGRDHERQNSSRKHVSSYTAPAEPGPVTVIYVSSDRFVISFSSNDSNFNHFLLTVCTIQGEMCAFNDTIEKTENTTTVTNLTSGTNYNISLYTALSINLTSTEPISITQFTRPSDLTNVTVQGVHNNSAEVYMTPADNRYNYIHARLCFTNNTCVWNITINNESHVFNNLSPATEYHLTVFTATSDDLLCENGTIVNFHTRPATPIYCEVVHTDLRYVSLNLSQNDDKFDYFNVSYMANELKNFSVIRDHYGNYTLEPLTPGTNYTLEVYTVFIDLQSDGYKQIVLNTKPEQIQNLKVENATSTSLMVIWDAPNEGNVDNINATFTCFGPNSGIKMVVKPNCQSNKTVTINDLEPGSFCEASITTTFGDQAGFPKHEILKNTTLETAPGAVEEVVMVSNTSRSIQVQWNRPSQRNGHISRYEIKASLEGTLIKNATLTCNPCILSENITDLKTFAENCTLASRCGHGVGDDQLQYNFTGLHPFRTYSISIRAFTVFEGNESTTNFQTAEDKPDGPPENLTGIPGQYSLNLKWDPPSYGRRNGIITNYTVRYTFKNNSCFNTDDGKSIENETTSVGNYTEVNLQDLLPYTDYTIQINAHTSVGGGNYSENYTFTTKQTVPGKINTNEIEFNTSDRSVNISWNTPCRPNGVITNYTIKVTSNNANDEQPDPVTTKSNATFEFLINLLPFRNYSISIIGNTIKGGQDNADLINITTQTGEPKMPSNVTVRAKSSKELTVTWKKPTIEAYTGITHYVIVAVDKENRSLTFNNSLWGFENNEYTIKGLEEYWKYAVNVTAETEAGNATSESVDGQTNEDVPLQVEAFTLSPERNVSRKRSIVVQWKPPLERNKNGIITDYFVEYSDNSSSILRTVGLSSNETVYNIENIEPGHYTVKINAATSKGNGTVITVGTNLSAGAPLKAPESLENPLMQAAASSSVSDSKTEIAVMLPTDIFLCNKTNGEPIEWGIVVAQDNKATDHPFNGKKADFDKKKTDVYKNYSDVKNEDSMSQYIATPISWSPCSFGGGSRKRRSIGPLVDPYIIGADGDCSKRCNGALKPGSAFRVKSYVCTSDGCTETHYSPPIATDPDRDPTVPIVAGTLSAIVVLIVAGGVVFILRRKQIACFSKDVESTHTHRPGNDITLDNIDKEKPHLFSPVPVKLVDFPECVEKMHRDSDLLFADAYRLLKEKSPNHPMTAAEQQCCRPKNRYTNILPYDHSRVKLRPSDDLEGSDYINANYIPGYTSKREYIATQGPMIATFDDFWRMVWEQNVDTIVMLTKLMEKGRHKCDKYWPDLGEPVYYGDLVVALQSESNLSDYTIKIFEVKLGIKMKKIKHFHFLQWPDFGCPDKHWPLINFISIVRQYRPHFPKGPLLVHCSAGVGRTGTFIAVDYLLQYIRDHDDVNIYSFVLEMRNHRLNMVQTEDQYVYIHECLKAFITSNEDEEEEDEEPIYENTKPQEENVYENTAFQRD